MGKSQRTKGHSFERWVARWFKELGYTAERVPQYRAGAHDGADVIVEELPYHIECKRVEALNIDKAYAQAENDCKKEDIPIVIHKKNSKHCFVTLKLEDFTDLIIHKYKKGEK